MWDAISDPTAPGWLVDDSARAANRFEELVREVDEFGFGCFPGLDSEALSGQVGVYQSVVGEPLEEPFAVQRLLYVRADRCNVFGIALNGTGRKGNDQGIPVDEDLSL